LTKRYISRLKRSRMPITTYQVVEPSHTRCCLCKRRVTRENVNEIRPTGFNGKCQEWTFCDACYLEYNEECNHTLVERIAIESQERPELGFHTELPIPKSAFDKRICIDKMLYVA